MRKTNSKKQITKKKTWCHGGQKLVFLLFAMPLFHILYASEIGTYMHYQHPFPQIVHAQHLASPLVLQEDNPFMQHDRLLSEVKHCRKPLPKLIGQLREFWKIPSQMQHLFK